jgi:hypothetical protein
MKVTFIALFLTLSVGASAGQLCDPQKSSLKDLNSHFSSFYKSTDCFFKIFNKAKGETLECTNDQIVKDFLALAPSIQGNAEAGEAYGESVETLLIKKSDCFLRNTVKLTRGEQHSLVFRLSSPISKEKKVIDDVLSKFKGDKDYSAFVALYFTKNCCTCCER